jgi:hypothetical protein
MKGTLDCKKMGYGEGGGCITKQSKLVKGPKCKSKRTGKGPEASKWESRIFATH